MQEAFKRKRAKVRGSRGQGRAQKNGGDQHDTVLLENIYILNLYIRLIYKKYEKYFLYIRIFTHISAGKSTSISTYTFSIHLHVHIHNHTQHVHIYTSQKNEHDTTVALHIHRARAAPICSFRPAASQPGPMTPAARARCWTLSTPGSGRQAKGTALAGPECVQNFPSRPACEMSNARQL